MNRKRIAIVVGVGVGALALLVAGCGGGGGNEASSTTTETTDTSGSAGGTKIIGTVGEEGSPDAFTITLTNEDGSAVTTLPAGDYTLEIKDLSTIHDFHLTGPGNVDVSSEVGSTEDKNYNITLVAGTYDYQCDPHASSMHGSFDVTG